MLFNWLSHTLLLTVVLDLRRKVCKPRFFVQGLLMTCKTIVFALIAMAAVACADNNSNQTDLNQSTGPYAGLTPLLSGNIPLEVPLPPADIINDPVLSRPFFDTFSWQSFIALSWPADAANRGIPIEPNSPEKFRQTNTTVGSSAPVVWETYREGFELFPRNNSVPPEWNSADPVQTPAGEISADRVLAMVTKGGAVGQQNEAFSGPLIDQNRNYARFEVRINQIEYDQVRNNRWYDKAAIDAAIADTVAAQISAGITAPQGIQFDTNSLEIKAAWRELTDQDDETRYYVRDALIANEDGYNYTIARMGLVGLHIMQKTAAFPQWIWSTFEQVDNVSGPHPSFNNGTAAPPSLLADDEPVGYNYEPAGIDAPFPTRETREPVQVTRAVPIPTTPNNPPGYSTQELNQQYRALLKGTVWENYQLIVTQWPLDSSLPSPYNPQFNPENYDDTFAGDPFPDYAANVTMETYFQKSSSCMECHYHAAAYGVDYSWILFDRVINTQ